MNISVEEKENLSIIKVDGELIISNVDILRKTWQYLSNKNAEIIALDCSDLDYIDSSAIGVLVKLLNSSNKKKIKFLIIELNQPLQNLLKIAKLDIFFITKSMHDFKKEYLLI